VVIDFPLIPSLKLAPVKVRTLLLPLASAATVPDPFFVRIWFLLVFLLEKENKAVKKIRKRSVKYRENRFFPHDLLKMFFCHTKYFLTSLFTPSSSCVDWRGRKESPHTSLKVHWATASVAAERKKRVRKQINLRSVSIEEETNLERSPQRSEREPATAQSRVG